MVLVCLFAYEARRCNYWLKANMEEYLRTCNVGQLWIVHIEALVKTDKANQTRSGVEALVPLVWLPETIAVRDTDVPWRLCMQLHIT